MIELAGVSHTYDRTPVLQGISTTLTERRIGVVGANGSGKSTFARLLNGLVVPTAGRVLVDGLDTRRDGRAVRRRVGFVFTDPDAQIVMPTVEEDLAFGLRGSGLGRGEISARVARTLQGLGLERHADRPAHLLSSGEKQLVALAGVLITEPEVLVCDEPTTLLDLRNARRVAELLDSLAQQVILVTHQLEVVRAYDRVLVLDEGRIVADDRPDAALAAYVELVR